MGLLSIFSRDHRGHDTTQRVSESDLAAVREAIADNPRSVFATDTAQRALDRRSPGRYHRETIEAMTAHARDLIESDCRGWD